VFSPIVICLTVINLAFDVSLDRAAREIFNGGHILTDVERDSLDVLEIARGAILYFDVPDAGSVRRYTVSLLDAVTREHVFDDGLKNHYLELSP
jgi:hypothetical protein